MSIMTDSFVKQMPFFRPDLGHVFRTIKANAEMLGYRMFVSDFMIDNRVRYWQYVRTREQARGSPSWISKSELRIIVNEEFAVPSFILGTILPVENPIRMHMLPAYRLPQMFTSSNAIEIDRCTKEVLRLEPIRTVSTGYDIFYDIAYQLAVEELKGDIDKMKINEFLEFYREVRYDDQLVGLVKSLAPKGFKEFI